MKMTLFWMFGLFSILAGCEGQRYSPFKIPEGDFFRQVKTVGVLPVTIGADAEEIPEKQKQLEQFLIEDLKIAGFQVVPSNAFQTIYDSLKEKMGALYDPYTGEADKEKKKALFEHTQQEYLRIHKVDAFVYSGVRVVKANWNGNFTRWHGAEEPTTGKKGFWANMNASNQYGSIPALSFWIHIEDVQGKACYSHIGGIQLYSRLINGDFAEVPKKELLSDAEKNRRGVGIATKALRESNRL